MTDSPERDEVGELVERMAFTTELDDGTRVRVRPVTSQDKQRLADGWQHLSAHSRYLRFMQTKNRLSESDLDYLTDIDYDDHFACGALALDTPGEPGIGIARYVRVADEPTVAEAAVAVIDERQRHGLGRILLQALIDAARENGIERFRAYVAYDNVQVIAALRALGATMSHEGGGMVKLDLPLPVREVRSSPVYAALRHVAAEQASSPDRAQHPEPR